MPWLPTWLAYGNNKWVDLKVTGGVFN